MGKYKYEAFDKEGKPIDGEIQATSEKDVRKQLRNQGIRVKKITPPTLLEFDLGEWMVEKGIGQAFGPKDLGQFTKQLSIMIAAGVPIMQSLEILHRSTKNPGLKLAVKKSLQMLVKENHR